MSATQPIQNRRSKKGFTLAELLIAIFITTLLSVGVTNSFILISRNFFAIGNYVDLNAQSRQSLEMFGRDMRMTAVIYSATSTAIDVDIMTPTGAQNVSYTYDAGARTFTRVEGTFSKVILEDVDALTMNYFTITDGATHSIGSIKKVQLSAITQRYVQNIKNTDHLITATYMMRNRMVAN